MPGRLPKVVRLTAGVGPKGRGTSRVVESVEVDPLLDAAWRRWGDEVAPAFPRLVQATARAARRRPSGAGFRKPRGGWPMGTGPGRRSASRFAPVRDPARREGGGLRFVVVENAAPYARALERGAYYANTGARRPRGRFIRRLYNKKIKRQAIGLVGDVFPDEVEARFRRRRPRA